MDASNKTLNYIQPYNAGDDPLSRSSALRQERRSAQAGQEEAGGEEMMESSMAEEDGMTFRQKKAQAKIQAAKIKKKEKNKLTPTKIASAKALKLAWLSLFTFLGFIPGLIYLNIHALSRMVMPSVTCKFGAEWIPPVFKGVAGEMGKSGSRIVGFFEKLALVALDFAVIVCLIAFASIVMAIINLFTDNWFGRLVAWLFF